MLFRYLLLIGLASMLAFIPIPAAPTPIKAQTPDNDAPYIYYFSDRYEAFVIERADGTDSHLLGQGLIDTSQVGYTQQLLYTSETWSPSGDWLAWQARSYMGNALRSRPFVMNIDGVHQVDWLADYYWADISWSPSEDVFLMIGQTTEYITRPYYTVNIILAEPETGGVFASLQNVFIPNSYEIEQKIWLDWILDGQYAVVEFKWNHERQSQIIYVLDTAGHMAYWQFEHVLESGQHTFESYKREPVEQSFSEHGEIAYLDANHHLVIHNFLTNTAQQFDIELNLDADIRWSPDGNYAFIYDPNKSSLWLYNSIESTVNLLSSDIDNLRFDHPHRFEPIWSPQLTSAVFPMNQGMYQVDLAMANLIDLEIPILSGNAVDWRWLSNKRIAISTYFEEPAPVDLILITDLITGQSTELVSLDEHISHSYGAFDISQDEETIYFVDWAPVAYDIQANSYQMYRPDARTDGMGSAGADGETYLNEDNDRWLFDYENYCVPGGCGIPRIKSLLDTKTGYKRDLPTTTEWLPPQVDVSQLQNPFYFPTPNQILQGIGTDYFDRFYFDIFNLSWSPDGRYIASEETLWDLATGERISSFDGDCLILKEDCTQHLEWILDTNDQYVPVWRENEILEGWEDYHNIAISPDKTQIVTGRNIYDTRTGELTTQIDGWGFDYAQYGFSPGGQYFVGKDWSVTKIWNTETWEVIAEIPYRSTAVAWSPDGTQIAIGVVWDVEIWDVAELIKAYVALKPE